MRPVFAVGLLVLAAGCELDDEPVACWYDGGGSEGTSLLDMIACEGWKGM